MDRQEIEAKVKEFLIEDLEIDEEKIQPEEMKSGPIDFESLAEISPDIRGWIRLE